MMKNGIINREIVIIEWVGPLCVRKRKSKSTSGRTEVASKRGRFNLTLTSFEVPFPNMYPKAKWPIANIRNPYLKARIAKDPNICTPKPSYCNSIINYINSTKKINQKIRSNSTPKNTIQYINQKIKAKD